MLNSTALAIAIGGVIAGYPLLVGLGGVVAVGVQILNCLSKPNEVDVRHEVEICTIRPR